MMMILFAVFIIALVMLVMEIFKKKQDVEVVAYESNDALDILKNRFAKGEISSEEFKEAKKLLSSK